MRTPLRLSPTALLLLAACGGGGTASSAFSPSYPDNRADAVAAAARDVSATNSTPSPDVAIAVTSNGLVGFAPSTGSVSFRSPVTTTVPVAVAGAHAIVESGGSVRVLALASGAEETTVSIRTGEHLIGSGAGGSHLAISILEGSGSTAHARLLLLDGTRVVEDLGLDRPIGVPAIAGERVLVPWAYQNLSVLDFGGHELARVRLRSGVVGHAIADRGRVWFGATTLFAFGGSSANESPTGYTLPDLGIERAPTLLPNAYEAPSLLSSAAYKVRLAFAVDPSSTTNVPADGTIYLVHYRLLFALDASSAETRWVRVLPSDVVGLRASVGGVRVATESGEVQTLRASDGRAIALASVGERVTSVTFPFLEALPAAEPVDTEPPNVRAQLFQAVEVSDARLFTAREYALTRLAALPDDDATSDLGVLCEDARLPERTRRKACDLLATRATGASHVESQLRRHGSFLAEEPHPPVGALARAAGTMNDVAAGPLLVDQLGDPRTTIQSIPDVARALVALRYADAVPALAAFVRTYHADASEEGMLDAIGAVAEAYAILGGESALNEVVTLSQDPLTTGPLTNSLRDAAARARQANASSTSTATTSTTTRSTTAATPPPAVPNHISMEMASPVLAPVQPTLAACLVADAGQPGSARVIIVVRRDGTVAEVLSAPSGPGSCLSQAILPLRFPVTRGAGPTVRITTTVRAH